MTIFINNEYSKCRFEESDGYTFLYEPLDE